jgi:hypothetical protein
MLMRLEDGSDQAFGHPTDLHKYWPHPIHTYAAECRHSLFLRGGMDDENRAASLRPMPRLQ